MEGGNEYGTTSVQVKTEFDDTQVKDGLKLVKELNVELEKANLLLDRLAGRNIIDRMN